MGTEAAKRWLVLLFAITLPAMAQRGPVRLQIVPNQYILTVGGTKNLAAQLKFFSNKGSGKTLSGASWVPANSSVANVDSTGLVTASSSTTGTTLITVTSGPFHATAWVTVVPASPLTSVTVAPQPAEPSTGVPNGETQQFLATAHFMDGSSQDVTDTCAWSVDNTSVAGINTGGSAPGLASAQAPSGTTFPVTLNAICTITIASVTKNGSASFVIGPAVPLSLSLQPAITTLPFGQPLQFQAWVPFSDGTVTNESSSSATTWSTNNSGVATVDVTHTSTGGTVTTTGIGSVTIGASYKDPTTATTVSASDMFTVTHSFDIYGGLNNIPCTVTGWFHTQKIGNQWWFCTPAGHVFFLQGIYVVVPDTSKDTSGHSYDASIKVKYGDDGPLWAQAINRRILSWGFNSQGVYNNVYALPTGTNPAFPVDSLGLHSQPYKMPFIALVRPAYYSMTNSPGPDGKPYLTDSVKDMFYGHSPYYSLSSNLQYIPPPGVADYYDSNIDLWLTSELTNQFFASSWKLLLASPYLNYMVGMNCDDSDEMYGFGAGPDFPTNPVSHNNNNLGWVIATMSPVQTANSSKGRVYVSTEVKTKTAWENMLKTKYSTISALNAAWGSNYTQFDSTGTAQTDSLGTTNGTSTTFAGTLKHLTPSNFSVQVKLGSAIVAGDIGNGNFYGPTISKGTINYATGAISLTFKSAPASGQSLTVNYIQNGWGIGTGLMDEDARPSHQAWVSADPYLLSGANANFKADASTMIEQTAEHYFKTCHDGIQASFPHIMYMGPNTLATWSAPSRKEVLQAAGKYFDVMVTGGSASFTTPMIDYVQTNMGDVPFIEGEYRTANPDSALFAYADSGAFKTQAARGLDYYNAVANLQTRAATNGTRPYIGTEWWQFIDNWGEKLNWGLVTTLDNAYDGKEAIIAKGTDPFGYPTGGELKNYGDCLTQVKAANAAWINNH
jgi:hypothetical protein